MPFFCVAGVRLGGDIGAVHVLARSRGSRRSSADASQVAFFGRIAFSSSIFGELDVAAVEVGSGVVLLCGASAFGGGGRPTVDVHEQHSMSFESVRNQAARRLVAWSPRCHHWDR